MSEISKVITMDLQNVSSKQNRPIAVIRNNKHFQKRNKAGPRMQIKY